MAAAGDSGGWLMPGWTADAWVSSRCLGGQQVPGWTADAWVVGAWVASSSVLLTIWNMRCHADWPESGGCPSRPPPAPEGVAFVPPAPELEGLPPLGLESRALAAREPAAEPRRSRGRDMPPAADAAASVGRRASAWRVQSTMKASLGSSDYSYARSRACAGGRERGRWRSERWRRVAEGVQRA